MEDLQAVSPSCCGSRCSFGFFCSPALLFCSLLCCFGTICICKLLCKIGRQTFSDCGVVCCILREHFKSTVQSRFSLSAIGANPTELTRACARDAGAMTKAIVRALALCARWSKLPDGTLANASNTDAITAATLAFSSNKQCRILYLVGFLEVAGQKETAIAPSPESFAIASSAGARTMARAVATALLASCELDGLPLQ